MRTIILCLLILLLGTSCSEERKLLNRIEGVFKTTEFVVTEARTDSVLFTASPTFQFDECDVDDDNCKVTIIDTDGTSYNYQYQLNAPKDSPDIISFRPTRESAGEENDLLRALSAPLTIEVRDDELNIFTDEFLTAGQDVIQGSRDYRVSIIAEKR